MAFTFLAFTDLHHEPQVFPHDAPRFLDEILKRGIDARAAFAVQLGDFLHTHRPLLSEHRRTRPERYRTHQKKGIRPWQTT